MEMSWHELDCSECDALNWVDCPEPEPGDLIGYYDYDGFKCYKCGEEQEWPGGARQAWEGVPTRFADGVPPPIFTDTAPQTMTALRQALPDWEIHTDRLVTIRRVCAQHEFEPWSTRSETTSISRYDWRKCIASVYVAAQNFEKGKQDAVR